ncbi:MAG TPA: molybdopterin-guanine dinucleotide biosynthesis protein B [Gemmatimonadaceae bacterium]|nr:molybdopterin-guanine dinucleotide biosynthesis protein B [Gemmatimonadaceae bacterium]
MPRPPMVAIVGRKHHGKTTLTVRLAAELRRRGLRVMTIKHGSHTFNLDPENTDTYRHYHEGLAEKVAMVSPDKFALVERWSEELPPELIAERHMSDADVVLCEGFKRSALPRIEIYRAAAGGEPLYDATSDTAPCYLAIVTDVAELPGGIPLIPLADPTWLQSVADLVERRIVRGEG